MERKEDSCLQESKHVKLDVMYYRLVPTHVGGSSLLMNTVMQVSVERLQRVESSEFLFACVAAVVF